ncbi:protein-L-isoaspartate O-methyltransferase [Enterovirga sp.]|uniref:protein-L-isoaspartate O-methyltransferase family protein n=1 Tax=Enterovirga sp. TaxID=2026350 RepID=UPI00262FE279|nr:protein-L-isoaspartate O-methyltransferase [Enterovirga sp.]MDB5590242.1 protein-L-isoaspartate O-methyltransferase [Enterovirga sp.]
MSAALRLPEPVPPSIETAAFVLSLRSRGIFDLAVLRAMERVPRDIFAPRRYGDLARQDVALPLPHGETMTAPAVVAQMLAALAVRPGQRVLEIGTGSGYVAALLARMGAEIRTVERHPVLAESAARRLAAAGLLTSCRLSCGDGFAAAVLGEGRYDRILLNGSVPATPAVLTSRLAAGGRMVGGLAPEGGRAVLLVMTRDEAGELQSRTGPALRLGRLHIAEATAGAAPATEA